MAINSQSRAFAPPGTLLVLKPSSFGDIVHTLPAVARLKAAWPDCRISWLANTEWMPLLQGNPDVDEIIEFPRSEFRGLAGWQKLGAWLRAKVARRRFDLALDFQGLLRSALIGRLSGASRLLGLRDAREGARWLYSVAPLPTAAIHAVDRYLALAGFALRSTGAGRVFSDGAEVHFPLPDGEAPPCANMLKDGYILLHPFARGNDKSLKEKDIKLLLRNLRPNRIVVAGRCGTAGIRAEEGTIDLLNQTTLPQLIWLIRRASFVISVDSGPAHLAAAFGRPMIAVHGWSDPRRVGPYRPDAWVWKNSQLVRARDLGRMENRFFEANPLALRESDIEAICELATSS